MFFAHHWTALALAVLVLNCSGMVLADPLAEQPAGYEEISRYEVDVTGDGKNDQVKLLGKRFEQASPFFQSLLVHVDNPVTQKQSVFTAEGGYGPKLEFCDFTGGKVNEILLSADTGGSGGIVIYSLFSLKGDNPVTLTVPPPLTIDGQFADKYKVNLTMKETNKAYTIDLRDRRQQYDQLGLYRKEKLVKPTGVMPNAYHLLKPVDSNRDGVCELQGVQRVAGVANADTIAYVTSLWKWQEDKWMLQDVSVQKADQ
ncbi:hypothetical protein [Brevibacillus sp. H7]|uniref:hypothetical protein n=1 Tax=Brevibacillus sp. H7 TaxID=3349138 RepID=UPI00381F28D9